LNKHRLSQQKRIHFLENSSGKSAFFTFLISESFPEGESLRGRRLPEKSAPNSQLA
jgi:hypothetical protein